MTALKKRYDALPRRLLGDYDGSRWVAMSETQHRFLLSQLPLDGSARQTFRTYMQIAPGGTTVIHYSCDRCKQAINPGEEMRYVVRIEVRAAMDFTDLYDDDEDDDRDYLMEAHEALERAEDSAQGLVSEDIYQDRRFDLCPSCYRKFMKNPVGTDVLVELNFSEN